MFAFSRDLSYPIFESQPLRGLVEKKGSGVRPSVGADRSLRVCSSSPNLLGPIHLKPYGIGRLPFFCAGPLHPPRGSEGSETESRGHLNVQVGAGPYLRSKQPWGRIGWGPQGTSRLPAARKLVRRGAKVQGDILHHTL